MIFDLQYLHVNCHISEIKIHRYLEERCSNSTQINGMSKACTISSDSENVIKASHTTIGKHRRWKCGEEISFLQKLGKSGNWRVQAEDEISVLHILVTRPEIRQRRKKKLTCLAGLETSHDMESTHSLTGWSADCLSYHTLGSRATHSTCRNLVGFYLLRIHCFWSLLLIECFLVSSSSSTFARRGWDWRVTLGAFPMAAYWHGTEEAWAVSVSAVLLCGHHMQSAHASSGPNHSKTTIRRLTPQWSRWVNNPHLPPHEKLQNVLPSQ